MVSPLLGKSPAILEVTDKIRRAAKVDSPVLIWGEEGAGKSQVAQEIHLGSRRAERPFVVVKAEDLSDVLTGGGVFGSSKLLAEPGAAEYGGTFESVQGGTLVITELSELTQICQAQLLETVENRQPPGLGFSANQEGDFRLMATTRHDPSDCVDRGDVREDLYYRLAVVTIRVPPLRERREDIPALVRQSLADLCTAHSRKVPAVSPELMRLLTAHPWPGNVRQLRDCLDAVVRTEDAELLETNHVLALLSNPQRDSIDSPPRQCIDTLAELERAAVMRALKVYHGNRTQAAKGLGISVRTLQRKLRLWACRRPWENAGYHG